MIHRRTRCYATLLLLLAVVVSGALTLRSTDAPPTPQEQILRELGVEHAVIFNGDDFGRTEWSNQGVIKAFDQGVLTSTSLMTPALARDQAYEIVAAHPRYDVGVHLILARDDAPGNLYGPINPADKTASFIDGSGHFITTIMPLIKADKNEVYEELRAQIDHALAHGVDVTHLDCHKGWYHDYNPRTLRPALSLAAEYDLPMRWVGRSNDPNLTGRGIVVPDNLIVIGGKLPFEDKKKQLLDSLNNLKPGITEYLFHPATGGYTPEEKDVRTLDLQLMLDADVRAAVERSGAARIGFKTLRDQQRANREP